MPGRGGAVQPDHRLRGHQLPVGARGEPAGHLLRLLPALRLLRSRELRAALRREHPDTGIGDRPQDVLPDRRCGHRGIRARIQPDTQRQDARGRQQPGTAALPHLRDRRQGRRRGGAQARTHAHGRHPDAEQDQERRARAGRRGAAARHQLGAQARKAVHVLVGATRPEIGAPHEGLRLPDVARLQAGGPGHLLRIGGRMVPGAGVHQVRQRAHRPLPGRHHRPADAAQRPSRS